MSSTEEWTICEDMDEAHLAQASFGEEVVVYWDQDGVRQHGIIVGYDDRPNPDQPIHPDFNFGMFHIDLVTVQAEDGTWRELGFNRTALLPRSEFVVFGPANREPGDREAEHHPDGWEVMPGTGHHRQKPHGVATALLQAVDGLDQRMAPFLCAVVELMAVDETGTGDLAFDVRLDAKVCDKSDHYDGRKRGHYHYRILIRPSIPPMMHDEIQAALRIASRYELAASHSNVGLELHVPEDL